ncbi:Protein unc-45-like protein B [Armadillidium nasatum]|uniref:Protein unc-45 homolog B n=1 Tax=Armadillidium nasatum TaxID=96803 RepID=A0A5N5TDA4_9CRUS|nr:Protein unc-45-like protein B [Armadillidium nasatum]
MKLNVLSIISFLALELTPNDPKALYRRAQAYEKQELFEKAYADARAVQNADPKNKEVQVMLSHLHAIVQDKLEKSTQLRSELLLKEGILGRIVQLLKSEKNPEIRVSCARTLSEFAKDEKKAKKVLRDCGLPWLVDLMNSTNESLVTATQYTFQVMLCTLSGMDIKKGKRPDWVLMQENTKEIDSIMTVLTKSITSRAMSGVCRDAIIEILCKNVGYQELDWVKKFLKIGGLEKLLEVASELQEYHYESCIDVTNNTRITTAVCLDKLYQAQGDDKSKQQFTDMIENFIRERLVTPEIENKVRVTVTLTTLLLGPLDVGNTFIGRDGILEMLLVMAKSGEELEQKVACEALIAASSKKDKCRAIMTQGTNILKELYQSKSDAIKVRALVGLCKLGSLGGTDATMRPFAEGASLKLAEACRRFLINPAKDKEMRRWACEGLSYLTLDADVKEKLVNDRVALRSMIQLAESGDMNCLYGVVTTFVNLVNAYDKQEVIPEMIELAKFSKQHVPEEHELDDKDFVDQRINILAEEGAASALVSLSKTESKNSKELIIQQQNRGKVVQQGGTKALLQLASDGTEKGKICAAQALARIAITINPEIAFPGQRAYEVVRPLLSLLHVECSALENFESLMGLCNIAGISESTRQRIIKEKGLPLIEHYLFEEHDLIRRAAFQCMANMCGSPDVVKILEGDNDKLKYLFLASSDEDEEIVKAAAGALCMVLPESNKCCGKIFEAKDWGEILQFLVSHANPEVHYRGTVIVYYIISASTDYAWKIMETHAKDALLALSKIENPELVHPKAKEFALKTLNLCVSQKVINPLSED